MAAVLGAVLILIAFILIALVVHFGERLEAMAIMPAMFSIGLAFAGCDLMVRYGEQRGREETQKIAEAEFEKLGYYVRSWPQVVNEGGNVTRIEPLKLVKIPAEELKKEEKK